jgi:hypothetical protein
MEKQRRREAVQAYKEKKVLQGIFAVRCAATGETWLGMSRNLDAQQNSIWFSLRMGTHRNKPLQAAWKAHGEAVFSLETIEVVDTEKLSPYTREGLLKDRLAHFLGEMSAQPLLA